MFDDDAYDCVDDLLALAEDLECIEGLGVDDFGKTDEGIGVFEDIKDPATVPNGAPEKTQPQPQKTTRQKKRLSHKNSVKRDIKLSKHKKHKSSKISTIKVRQQH